MGIAVGIDLGTTNSCVAVVQGGRARVLEDSARRRVHPSIVSFPPDGSVLAGYAAKERLIADPENTIYSIKRLIGRNIGTDEIKRVVRALPYKVVAGPDDIPVVRVRGRDISLPEVSALMLRHLREMCRERIGFDISEAVITVPANFNDLQRSSTKVAARIAGFDVMRIINEPTAAALAYGFGGKLSEKIAIYDFGGGTFDITIVELEDEIFEVLSTAGDTYLGGDDFDNVIIDEMARELKKRHHVELSADRSVIQRIRSVAEKVKCQLSAIDEVQATLKDIVKTPSGKTLDFQFKLSRKRFESLVAPLVERSMKVCDEAFKLAGLKPSSIDNLVLVGGTTRIPLVRAEVARHFGLKPRTEINPDEVVAIGAAIQAFSLSGEQLPHDLPNFATKPPIPPKLSHAAVPTTRTLIGVFPPAKASAPQSQRSGSQSLTIKENLDLDVKHRMEELGLDVKRDALELDVKRSGDDDMAVDVRRDALELDVKRRIDDDMALDVRRDALELDVKRRVDDDMALDVRRDALELDVKRRVDDDMAVDVRRDALELDIKCRGDDDLELDLYDTMALTAKDRTSKTAGDLSDSMPAVLGIDMDLPLEADARHATGIKDTLDRKTPSVPGAGRNSVPKSPMARRSEPDHNAPVENALREESFADVVIGETDDARPMPPRIPPRSGTEGSFAHEPSAPLPDDEVVAGPGATKRGSSLPAEEPHSRTSIMVPATTDAQSALLLDVTPRALGIGVAGGYCDIIIERNASIPIEQSRLFTTSTDNQTQVAITVYQGESRRVSDNTVLGQVLLTNLRAARRGEIKIRVTFEIDTDGILGVSARNEETSEAQNTKIELTGGMDEEKVEALVRKYAIK